MSTFQLNMNDAVVYLFHGVHNKSFMRQLWVNVRETKFNSRRAFTFSDSLVWMLGSSSKHQQELFGSTTQFIYSSNTIYPSGAQTLVYLGKGVGCKNVFRQYYPGTTFLQMPVWGWYKS